MTTSIYASMIGLRDVGGNIWERLGDLAACQVFQPLYDCFRDEQDVFNSIFFYILDCYSVDSKCIALDRSWLSFKQERFNFNRVPDGMRNGVLGLQHPDVKEVIANYVEYQKETEWMHLCMLQDVYVQLCSMAVQMGEGVNADNKYKAAVHARDILVDINTYKSAFTAKFAVLSPASEELPAPEKKKVSLQVEDYTVKDGI